MKVCYFCGSSNALKDEFYEVAEKFGVETARKHWTLVSGGANVGLMKVLAESCLNSGGKTLGIMPEIIADKGLAYLKNTDFIITKDMAERKKLLIEKSDAFIALPGGFGTLDEISEVIVLNQINVINKPLVIYNYKGFYDALRKQFEVFFKEKFAKEIYQKQYLITSEIEEAFDFISDYNNKNIDEDWFRVGKEDF